MAATTHPRAEPAPATRLPRFDRVERALHWANATLFAVMMATGAALYVGPLATLVGRRALLKEIHEWTGLCLPVPFALALAGRWGPGFRRDVTRLNRWDGDDRRWLRTLGRDRTVRLGKFNPGQKLNAAFVIGAIVLMLATGSIMKWYGPFADDIRTGATFVHDWVFIALVVVITGHIAFALRDPESLRSMVRGWVPVAWARRHRPKWAEEVSGEPPPPPAAPPGERAAEQRV